MVCRMLTPNRSAKEKKRSGDARFAFGPVRLICCATFAQAFDWSIDTVAEV